MGTSSNTIQTTGKSTFRNWLAGGFGAGKVDPHSLADAKEHLFGSQALKKLDEAGGVDAVEQRWNDHHADPKMPATRFSPGQPARQHASTWSGAFAGVAEGGSLNLLA